MRRVLISAVALACLGLFAAGCGGSFSAFGGPANVRVVHAVTDQDVADLDVNGRVVLEDAEFGDTSDLALVVRGENTATMRFAGRPGRIADAVFDLDEDETATVVFGGQMPAPAAFVVTAGPSTTRARVRVLNTARREGTVDVVAESGTLASGLRYGQVSSGVLMNPRGLTVRVRRSGRNLGSVVVNATSGETLVVVADGVAPGAVRLFAAPTLR